MAEAASQPGNSQLQAYAQLLKAYAGALHLMSPAGLADLPRHLRQSLAFAELLGEVQRVIDLGSGAGLPAIPLAIALPQVQFTLVESHRRRAAFLRRVVAACGLDNVQVLPRRAEDYGGPRCDTATAKAFGPLDAALALARLVLRPGGRLVVQKGRDWRREWAEGPGAALVAELAVEGSVLVALQVGESL